MNEELYDIYKRNFKDTIREDATIRKILSHPDNHVIEFRDRDELVGVSLINASTIIMLCVDEDYRKRGIGSALLKSSEEYIKSEGYDKVNIGEGFDYLTPGVPIRDNNLSFFQKRGYIHAWGDDECFDMAMDLKELGYKESLGDIIDGIEYRFATIDDLSEIETCVKDAEPKFVSYYQNPKLYDATNDQRVLIATIKGEVCGTLIISIETEAEETGSVGCTTTKTNYRHRGIATNLVKIGTKYLKDIGMKKAYLGYTYTGLDKLYGYSGYEITTKYFMAEKSI